MTTEVDFQEVQENTDELLDRVEQGETFLIIFDGRPVAELMPHQTEV